MLNFVYKIYTKVIKRFLRKVKVNYYKNVFGVTDLDIYFPVFLEPVKNITIGEGIAINAFVHIWANAKVEIGSNTLIASHVQITTSTHDYNINPMRTSRIDMPVKIGNNVWIGSGAIIFPGVSIGDNSVIGAGALVNKDIPANSVAYGVPAKVSKQLTHETK